jgi:bifunctional enzyme CysN/CysC
MSLDLLRFTTAGSVDDGKSTLIGRLLYDSKQVFEDQLAHIREVSKRRGGDGALDLSLLVDGLRAEREQGITIDVAYRYFATAKRRFIIADTPGHVQYTRNMVTGASTADLAVILLDARTGVVEQTRRHALIASLLGIPHLVVAVNKMDLVDYDQRRFDEIKGEFLQFAPGLEGRPELHFIPLSALHGDNVVERSTRMGWYEGPTLLELLETVEVAYDHPDQVAARFPVQWVIRPGPPPNGKARPLPPHLADPDYRAYAGQLASGRLRVGEEVVVLPAGLRTEIVAIDTFDGPLAEAVAPMSVALRLADDLDVSRGDLICRPDEEPPLQREVSADLCWMVDRPLRAGNRYLLRHTTREVHAIVQEVVDRLDIHTLERHQNPGELGLNDIGLVKLKVSQPLALDSYRSNRRTGCFILIDPADNATAGAGMAR